MGARQLGVLVTPTDVLLSTILKAECMDVTMSTCPVTSKVSFNVFTYLRHLVCDG